MLRRRGSSYSSSLVQWRGRTGHQPSDLHPLSIFCVCRAAFVYLPPATQTLLRIKQGSRVYILFILPWWSRAFKALCRCNRRKQTADPTSGAVSADDITALRPTAAARSSPVRNLVRDSIKLPSRSAAVMRLELVLFGKHDVPRFPPLAPLIYLISPPHPSPLHLPEDVRHDGGGGGHIDPADE